MNPPASTLSLNDTAMLLGAMLLTAVVAGHCARLLHTPRVVGYLVGGCVLKATLQFGLEHTGDPEGPDALQTAAAPLSLIKDLALGLILFTIGGVFERSRFRSVIRHVSRIATLEIAFVFVLVAVGCGAVAWCTGVGPDVRQGMALAVLLGAAAIATAPAATLSVIQEYEAKGPITDTILGLTGINNIACIVLFHCVFLCFLSVGWLERAGDSGLGLIVEILVITVGSIALGSALGMLISVAHERFALSESVIVLLALISLMHAGEQWLTARWGSAPSLLLASLVMGAVFANTAIDSRKLDEGVRTLCAPVITLFFVLAGFDLHLGDLRHMGWLGAAYVVFRFAGKELGCYLGTRRADAPQRTSGRLGEGLLCQAAVVVGLAAFVRRTWASPLAETFSAVVLGSVVVFELIGPLLLKRRVVQGGEVKLITLLSRSVPAHERPSMWRGVLDRITHVLPVRSLSNTNHPAELQVRHIMRSNVQLIRASDTLDEVLHFIERSTHSHFPVVEADSILVGVIHFSDVRDVIYDPAMRELVTALDLANPDFTVVTPDTPLRDLLEAFADENVGVLPVVESADHRRFRGLVEQRDLLRALHLQEREEGY